MLLDSSSAVILGIQHSKNAILKPVSMKDVRLEDGFWNTRYQINLIETIPSQYELLETTGRIDNFIEAGASSGKTFKGYVYNDSDVYKWLEAASWSFNSTQAGQIQPMVKGLIDLIGSAQQDDGYLNTYFVGNRRSGRWTNLQVNHELYCAGHLIQAAVAHHRMTGENELLDIAVRLADHIYDVFGPSKTSGTSGHPEIEMALIELYRTNGNVKYLELAKLLIDRRGYGSLGSREYLLDHQPFRDLELLAGHAVRALYLCAGAADLYLETGETQLLETLERLWERMVQQQVYITGGVGSRYDGESFGAPYELPNATAYAETCAAIASVMWNWRMLQITGDARYSDAMEWTVYNAVLPGISQDGKRYLYVNPLKSDGNIERKTWFDCACCPPNLSRMIAMLPGYIYSQSEAGVWINLYANSSVIIQLMDGRSLSLRQNSTYPWDGKIKIEISDYKEGGIDTPGVIQSNPFSIFIRIPGWVTINRVCIKVNDGIDIEPSRSGSYLEINRNWLNGDVIDIDFPMDVQYHEAHPLVLENTNRTAITRGPLVYCFEAEDNPGISLDEVIVNPAFQPSLISEPGFIDECIHLVMDTEISSMDAQWKNTLYQAISTKINSPKTLVKKVIAIPYFHWANRNPGAMQVWTRYN